MEAAPRPFLRLLVPGGSWFMVPGSFLAVPSCSWLMVSRWLLVPSGYSPYLNLDACKLQLEEQTWSFCEQIWRGPWSAE